MGVHMSRKEKDKNYWQGLEALLAHSAFAKYLEPERKLDAACEGTLDKVVGHIRRTKYYVPVNHATMIEHAIPPGLHVSPDDINHLKINPARETTARRLRIYYDTPSLDLYRGGVELRIEFPKATEHGHAKPYKQVVKLGRAATEADPTFHRIEISGRLAKPVPSFESNALDDNKRLSAFLKRFFNAADVKPLQILTTVRDRLWCYPGGDPNTIVEFGIDRGHGMTVTGHRYPLLQIEPEVTKGDDRILEEITPRLLQRFKESLTVNLRSKPSPGFDNLAGILRGNDEGIRYLRGIKQHEFRFVTPEQCPALFPEMK